MFNFNFLENENLNKIIFFYIFCLFSSIESFFFINNSFVFSSNGNSVFNSIFSKMDIQYKNIIIIN